jgi:hypothetical protein
MLILKEKLVINKFIVNVPYKLSIKIKNFINADQ